jgi:hypothetical protein
VKRSGESAVIPAQELYQPMLPNQLRSSGNKSGADRKKGAEDKALEILASGLEKIQILATSINHYSWVVL